MRIALHPTSKQPITVEDYISEFGHPPLGSKIDTRPEAICRFCKNRVYVAGEGTTRIAHFKHHKGDFCPSKEPAGRPYLPLTPTNPDPEAGARLRRAFRAHWKWHYVVLRTIVPKLDLKEFTDLIALASRHRVWDYVDFPETDIPYVFVILADFPPWTGYKKERIYWFRFWFSPNIRAIDHLWIRPEDEVVLYRASFEIPKGSRAAPKYEALVKEKQIPIVRTFLTEPEPDIHEFIVAKVEEWFAGRNDF